MEGDSTFFYVASVAIINCSEMTIFPQSVALSTELFGRNSISGKEGHGSHSTHSGLYHE